MDYTTPNTYGIKATEVGRSVPVWLGKPVALPGGFTVVSAAIVAGRHYEAGSPVIYDAAAKTIVPFYINGGTLTAGDGTSSADNCNGYLYNDIYISENTVAASGAVIVSHAEGVLIDRTAGASIAAKLKANCPNVIQVKD